MKKFTFIFGFIMLLPLLGNADIIFFKDGMKTVCQERAWREDQEVKCEYEGTIISYKWKDVFRIQEIRTAKKDAPLADQEENPVKPAVEEAIRPDEVTSPVSQPKPPKPPAQNELKTVSIKPVGPPRATGLEFYNPRRPQKYWTSATSKHQTFKEAIAALAKQYDRSPQWIQQQMGETNDLDDIHRNLSSSKTSTPDEPKAVTVKKASDTLFYNPRRPQKYWTSATAKHKSFKEAISALSTQYDRSAQWVQQHMGDSNNLSEIHHNLKNQKASETQP